MSSLSKEIDDAICIVSTFKDISSMDKKSLLEMALNITKQYRAGVAEKERTINHLKPLGILGFQDLTRVIAAQWAKLIQSTKSIFEFCSNEDRKIYAKLRIIWRSEKDAKIKQKLDEQVLHEESSEIASHGRGNLQAKYESNFPCPSRKYDEISQHSSPPLRINASSPASMSGLVRLVSNESSDPNYNISSIPSFEPIVSANSNYVSCTTNPSEATTNLQSNNKSYPGLGIEYDDYSIDGKLLGSRGNCWTDPNSFLNNSDEVQTAGSLYSNVQRGQYSKDLKNVSNNLGKYHSEFQELREALLNDVFDGDNLLDLFLSVLK
eukprot:CAMPEP_0197828000 /NCGR_PEP_ID=MMETSP1437-20131217/4659_1 /TAXON_ID=49252 ORGANISM="Eucampia antarctica, Strain CCMP1452" /NCGR_SAMPLE_ID=MMETSP1437 /ASSEMBLY_ACC=CAM_ASM_001096 /LENGTH=321 /DNA_ID=CAMNT_0043429063 /DNA_START=158 /DNA_END=1123 /DNA_ORIENTATION=+